MAGSTQFNQSIKPTVYRFDAISQLTARRFI